MRRSALVVLASLFFVPLLQAQERITAFENVNVIPMTEETVHENWTVVVRDDRITAAGPANEVEVPPGAERIDGTGRYLIPGLAEMHGHVPNPTSSPQHTEDVLLLFVANGVTTVRGMQGSEGQLELRERAERGEIVAPNLYLAGPGFSGGSIDSPEEAEQRVREQHGAGWDFLKVLPGLTREEYDAMARTANELGIPFVGHIPQEIGLVHGIEAGQQTIDHVDGYIEYLDGEAGTLDERRLAEAVRLTNERGVWIVPTMALWETIIGYPPLETLETYPELAYMPSDQVAQWKNSHRQRRSQENFSQEAIDRMAKNRIEILRALHEGDVRILMGTDAPQQFSVPGFSLRREFPIMAASGMTPYEILASGSKNVGEYLSEKDSFGTIAEGQRADLILLKSNPLVDAMHALENQGVMVSGRWYSREELDRGLEEIRSRSAGTQN